MDLSGDWRAAVSDDERRREALQAGTRAGATEPSAPAPPDLHNDWFTLRVPGHWQEHPDLTHASGPLLYRREFTLAPPTTGRRRWLQIDGVFSQADLWLDGAYLGDAEGYAQTTAFEITALSGLSEDHDLLIEVSSPAATGEGIQRVLTGAHQRPARGPLTAWNPGGISGPVTIAETGPVRIARTRVLCRDADAARAHVLISTLLDSDIPRRVRVRTAVNGSAAAETEHLLAAGHNEVAWTLDIPEPALWWPRGRGEQNLTEITVEVRCEGVVSDAATRVTGLREVAWDDWVCSVNGQRIFLQGADLPPISQAIASVSQSDIEADLDAAIDAGLNLLRVHSHLAPDAFYAAADARGLLVLQDLGLTARYARALRDRAVSHARAAVDRLGHHPSIVMWVGHDDPHGHRAPGMRSRAQRLGSALWQQVPSWNRTVLDMWVTRTVQRADPTRPCTPSSGVAPHLPLLDGGDSHLEVGWSHGRVRDLAQWARVLPRRVRFVSEFGAQAVAQDAEFIDDSRWPELDWDELASTFGADREVLTTRFPPEAYPTRAAWALATQEYQAEVIRGYVETLRRLKYRPTGGFCLFALTTPTPAISHAVLDHHRQPTLGYAALRAACRPVLPIADLLNSPVPAGSSATVQIHVVNDLICAITDAELTVTVSTRPADQDDHDEAFATWRFGGEIPPDDCVRIGRVTWQVPADATELTLTLTLRAGGQEIGTEIRNAYHYRVRS